MSLPSRERGLKLNSESSRYRPTNVAPLAGAWIEIKNNHTGTDSAAVAPLAGAWIEIAQIGGVNMAETVAPLAGAWIEIMSNKLVKLQSKSLPSRERGLKSQ